MEVLGTIRVIGATQEVTASYKKRELVVTTDEQYPQHISVDFGQDKCDILDKYKVGDAVKVSINLRGKEWVNPKGETKFFNSVQGWRIEKQTLEKSSNQKVNDANAEMFAMMEDPNDVEDDFGW